MIYAGEFLSLEGEKMSTSKNWVIWIADFVKDYDPDLLRYYLTINAPLNKDSDFSWDDFQRRNNDELADVIGNFLHRTFTFTRKYFDNKIPEYANPSDEDEEFKKAIEELPAKAGEYINNHPDLYKKFYSSGRVAQYAKEIAQRYGYDEKRQEKIFMMGLLHDVGKIGVPDWVINKPGRLTDEEFGMIKKHPSIGDKILSNIKEMPELASGAKCHHERFDGRGYPEGLAGDNIPEEARIIAVADAYDAMTSKRSYRNVLSQEIVRGEIEKGKGSQFDPKFADIMLGMIDEDKEYKMRDTTIGEGDTV